jgi:transaldolase/glucose-6-phosphate isomerase
MNNALSLHLGEYQRQVDQRLNLWAEQKFFHRIWEKDPYLWGRERLPEITDRLGWLDLPKRMEEKCDGILTFAHQIQSECFSHVLLVGMGGSSLAPEVFQKTFGGMPGFPELLVLDSTHPDAVLAAQDKLDIEHTLFIISSKSGTTLETLSLFQYFWDRASVVHARPGRCFAAITDAGSPLEALAREKNFRAVFLPCPDVGGRYSAFTEFGLVPAALIGMDIRCLLHNGLIASQESRSPGPENKSIGFILGAVLGELTRHKDKLTIWTSPSLDGFPVWLEQLLAESTGKQGKGIVPVVGEPKARPEVYGRDRIFTGIFLEEEPSIELENHFHALANSGHPTIRIYLKEKAEMGQEIFRWELATASAGSVLGIHPFDQPDVQLAKDLTRSVMERDEKKAGSAKVPVEEMSIEDEIACASAVEDLFSRARPGDYTALQAYLSPSQEITQSLQNLRNAIFERTRLATTLGFGPRFLHSTGQLHKGGPNTVLAIQLVDRPEQELPIPGTDYTFASLIGAQAIGDYHALRQKKRRVLRINLGKSVFEGLQNLGRLFINRE